MPRLHFVKKARKDYPNHDIKKGESYYWWQFAFRSKSYSKTKPSRSQLTQSSFLQTWYSLEDSMDELFNDFDSFESELDDFQSQVEELRDECQNSFDNIPEQLQDSSPAAMTLQERIDELENFISELESISIEDIDEDELEIETEGKTEGEIEEEKAEKLDELKTEKVDEYKQQILDSMPSF